MSKISILVFAMVVAALLSLAGVAAAQDGSCLRSSECEGSAICSNLSCVKTELDTCAASNDCGWAEICVEGYCKPAGVTCSNDAGQCSVEAGSGDCECMDGDGMGWASDSADGEVPDVPVAGPSDEELYVECRQNLVMSCGTEAPVPPDVTAVCTQEQLATCTGFVLKLGALDAACEDYWDDDDDPVASGTDSSDDIGTSGSGGDDEGDGDVEDTVDLPMPAPDPDGEWPRVYPQVQADPWEVEDCCSDLQEVAAEEPEYLVLVDQYFACVDALADGDCDGYMACEEVLDNGEDDWTTEKVDQEDSGGDADGDGDGDSGTIGLDDEDGEAAGGSDGIGAPPVTDSAPSADPDPTKEDKAPAEPDGDNSGCSFAPVSTGSTIVTLLKAFF